MASSENISIDFHGKDVFQGSSIMMVITYTGSKEHAVVESNNIIVNNKSNSPNVDIISYTDSHRKKNVDTSTYTITEPYMITVKDNANTAEIQLEFTTDVTGSTFKKTVTYQQHNSEDLSPDSLYPITMGNPFIEDLYPAEDGKTPNDTINGHVGMEISPRKNDATPMPYCQIALALEADTRNYARLYHEGTELFPYDDNRYYINTNSAGNAKVRFYPRKMIAPYTKPINVSVDIGDDTAPATQELLFFTKDLFSSDKLKHLLIPRVNGNELDPPLNESDSSFDVYMNTYSESRKNDKVYIMNQDYQGVKTICAMGLYDDRNANFDPFQVPYGNFMPGKTNILYYYIMNEGKEFFKSKEFLFKLTGDVKYTPPAGNLVEVAVFDMYGVQIDDDGQYVIGLSSIAGGGLKCVVPVGGENQVQLGDTITLYYLINGYDPKTSAPRSSGKLHLKPQKINSGNTIDFMIPASNLSGFGTTLQGQPGYIYIYYINSSGENSKSWQGFIDTASLDG